MTAPDPRVPAAVLRSVRSVVESPVPAPRPAVDEGRDMDGWLPAGRHEVRLEPSR